MATVSRDYYETQTRTQGQCVVRSSTGRPAVNTTPLLQGTVVNGISMGASPPESISIKRSYTDDDKHAKLAPEFKSFLPTEVIGWGKRF